jgi:flavodoxin
MKTLIVYTSLTGNTKKVAEAIAQAIGNSDLYPIAECPDPTDYPLVLVGFWVDRGQADAKTQAFLSELKNKSLAIFFTLGAYPDSPHADEVVKVTEELLLKGDNELLGSFRCQGKVDPALLERMKKMLPPDHPHAMMTDERKARLEEAAKHPNDEDLMKAKAFADDVWHKAISDSAKQLKAVRS